MRLPTPDLFTDWREWANKLVQALKAPKVHEPVQPITFDIDKLPRATVAGQIIMVRKADGSVSPYFSTGGQWKALTYV